jgi:hypothetical protein
MPLATPLAAAIKASAMPLAISPYSTAVAPCSAVRKRISRFLMARVLPGGVKCVISPDALWFG